MSACKCGHLPATHIGGAGLCTDAKCDCDGYVAKPRAISDEARTKARALCQGFGLPGLFEANVATALQDGFDQRDSWQRDAAKLLAQRDYAERRTNELEQRLAALVEQLRAVLAKHDTGAAR